MRVTIKSLRTGIVVVAGVLIFALVLFFAYARYQMRRIGKDLPARLGLQIQQSTKGYAVTHYDKQGHAVFTVHASKVVQFKNGHAALHDVGITLYGPHGERADRIYGSDFDYDQGTGVASASGEVQIDLSSPTDEKSARPNSQAGDDDASLRTIHVKTSGLTFNQKTGVATTEQAVEFHLPKAAGKAVGATYDSQLGLLVLSQSVEIESSTNGAPLIVRASHAQIQRDNRQAFLLNAATEFENERSSSDQATVYFRPDGSAERIDAKGKFHLETDSGQKLNSQTAAITLDAHSQPAHADLAGGLFFLSEDMVHHMRGNAVEGSFQFTDGASLRHVQLRNAVSFVDQQTALPGDPRGSSTREVRASKLDVDFAPGPAKRTLAQKALATGEATVVLHSISTTGPEQNTTIAADQLLATLANGNTITALIGHGQTKLTTGSPGGPTQTSTGDSLEVTFAPVGPPVSGGKTSERESAKAPAAGEVLESASSRLQSAVQQGNVTITQTPAPETGKAAPVPIHATAQRAEYQAADQALHLLGKPRLSDGALDLIARAIDLHRDSGNATATGDVKATYIQAANAVNGAAVPSLGGQGPAHVVAAEAVMNRATGDATFRGSARLWQGTNSIAAPVIEVSRAQQTLNAHGEGAAPQVNAAFSMAPDTKHQQTVIRINSHELLYSEGQRVARFHGLVVAQDTAGTIRSDQAEVFLVPSSAPGQNSGQSQIDRLIATGHVVLLQPGRRGSGERLLYTQQDGRCVLTGTALAPPRLSDQVHGTVTGASLIFNTRDDSVSVNGGPSSAVTETRVSR